jgi:hypothetical protein
VPASRRSPCSQPSQHYYRRGMRSAEDRFWAKVDKSHESGCWLWIASLTTSGYGQFKVVASDPPVRAHRYAYELVVGPVPDGMVVCHSCDVPRCVNPSHLWVGTHGDNMRDMSTKGRAPQGETQLRRAVLTEDQVLGVIQMLRSGATHRKIAARYGINSSTVTRINTGGSWKHLPR